jgi:hypothetical protein
MKIKIKMPGLNETELDKRVKKARREVEKSYSSADIADLIPNFGPLLFFTGLFGFHYFAIRIFLGIGGSMGLAVALGMTLIMWFWWRNIFIGRDYGLM